jgi:hypothetical protein
LVRRGRLAFAYGQARMPPPPLSGYRHAIFSENVIGPGSASQVRIIASFGLMFAILCTPGKFVANMFKLRLRLAAEKHVSPSATQHRFEAEGVSSSAAAVTGRCLIARHHSVTMPMLRRSNRNAYASPNL